MPRNYREFQSWHIPEAVAVHVRELTKGMTVHAMEQQRNSIFTHSRGCGSSCQVFYQSYDSSCHGTIENFNLDTFERLWQFMSGKLPKGYDSSCHGTIEGSGCDISFEAVATGEERLWHIVNSSRGSGRPCKLWELLTFYVKFLTERLETKCQKFPKALAVLDTWQVVSRGSCSSCDIGSLGQVVTVHVMYCSYERLL